MYEAPAGTDVIPQRLRQIEQRLRLTRLHVFRATPSHAEAPAYQDLRFGFALESELLNVCLGGRLDLEAKWVRRAIRRGDRCLAAFRNNHIVGYLWIAAGWAPHLDPIEVRVPPGVDYRYKCYVDPEFRCQGVARGLYRFADSLMRVEGRTCALLCVSPHNLASIHAARAAGATRVGYLAYWHAEPFFLSFHSAGARRAGLSFSRCFREGVS